MRTNPISTCWRPIGSGVMLKKRSGFLVKYLFDGEDGLAMAARIDRKADLLLGQSEVHLLDDAVSRSLVSTLRPDRNL